MIYTTPRTKRERDRLYREYRARIRKESAVPTPEQHAKAAAQERAAAHAALKAKWDYQGGLWYCKAHAVLARWTGNAAGGADPWCWKCERPHEWDSGASGLPLSPDSSG
jgi:hypothetical protein